MVGKHANPNPVKVEIRPRWDWKVLTSCHKSSIRKLKSDQDGIERFQRLSQCCSAQALKSDQDGIERGIAAHAMRSLTAIGWNQTKMGLKDLHQRQKLWSFSAGWNQTKMGLKDERQNENLAISSWLKSDQDGIESTIYARPLARWKYSLKSDQDGIERSLLFCLPGWLLRLPVEIRPRWDWKMNVGINALVDILRWNQTKMGLKALPAHILNTPYSNGWNQTKMGLKGVCLDK